MTLERPKQRVKRVVLIARDPDGESPTKCVTMYETTPQEVIEQAKANASEVSSKGGRRASTQR